MRGSAYDKQKVPRTSPSLETSGSDHAAPNPWPWAKSRASSGHRGSLEVSGMITRCFVNAAAPHGPLLGPIVQDLIAALIVAGTRGPANGDSRSPSFKQISEVTGEA